MPTKIRSNKLTTCRVAHDGSNVGLEFVDFSGAAYTVELTLDQAEAVVMTLPKLLSRAVRTRTGDDDARYVFGLDGWSVEKAGDQDFLILTLKTTNDFEVSFAVSREACGSLAWILDRGANDTAGAPMTAALDKLN